MQSSKVEKIIIFVDFFSALINKNNFTLTSSYIFLTFRVTVENFVWDSIKDEYVRQMDHHLEVLCSLAWLSKGQLAVNRDTFSLRQLTLFFHTTAH